MKTHHRFTPSEDARIKREVEATPENVLYAHCRAAAAIYRIPELAMLKGRKAHLNTKIGSVRNRWYRHISVINAEVADEGRANYSSLLHSNKHTARNRKVQARGKTLLIAVCRTPREMQRRASQELATYLGYTHRD